MIPTVIEAGFDKKENEYHITFYFHTPQEIRDFINALVENKIL